jgi:AcrR family transcriptional regulator
MRGRTQLRQVESCNDLTPSQNNLFDNYLSHTYNSIIRMIIAEPKTDTKQRILDSAERLFADNGFEASSLRAIIADAKVNLAAIHYHYHSKEALLEAVIQRRVAPINQERLRLLDECERAAGVGRPSLEAVLQAFVGPPCRIGADPNNKTFVRLIGRIMSQNSAVFRQIFERHFRVVAERFVRALRTALPELSEAEIWWRLNFAGGALAQVLRSWGPEDDGSLLFLPGPVDAEGAIARLVSFAAAGFRAPAPVERAEATHV